MTRPTWLEQRLSESPAPLRARLEAATFDPDRATDLSDGLLDAACRLLEKVRGREEEREAAFDLLVADGLLTLACEAAAVTDPETLADRCRIMGPGGKLGSVASRWVGRG